jgi:hypothetical protein
MTTEQQYGEPGEAVAYEQPSLPGFFAPYSLHLHHYYHREGVTDIDAMRHEARMRLAHSRFPEESIIHLHLAEEECDQSEAERSRPRKHELYLFEEVTK